MKKIFLFAILISFLSITKSQAQEFPLGEFLEMYLNQDEYSLEDYVVDTNYLLQRKMLDRLQQIGRYPFKYSDTIQNPGSWNYDQFYYFTDLDNDGINEHLIYSYWEGGHINFYEPDGDNLGHKDVLEHKQGEAFFITEAPLLYIVDKDNYLDNEFYSYNLFHNAVHTFDFSTDKLNYLFKFYLCSSNWSEIEDGYVEYDRDGLKFLVDYKKARPFILKSVSEINHDFYIETNDDLSMGMLCAGSYGWILGDTLDSYFVVFDSNTRYISNRLADKVLDYTDKGYLFTWIPKNTIEFGGGRATALYKDYSTNEYLRIFEGKEKLYVTYFTDKKFDIQMVVKDRAPNKITAQFNGSDDNYILYFTKDYQSLQCQNPDGTVQVFSRQ